MAHGVREQHRYLGKMSGGQMSTIKTNKIPSEAALKKVKQQVGLQAKLSAEHAEAVCNLFEVFDNMGRRENNDRSIPGFEWRSLCDDFSPLNDWLCPSQEVVQEGICSHRRPWLNPSIREHYCGPILRDMQSGPRRDSCETWCTNYVSKDRGDCCDVHCDD